MQGRVVRIVVVALALGLVFAARGRGGAEGGSDDALVAKVDALAARALEQPGAVGLSVAVARGGRVVVSKGYGKVDLEHNAPASEASVFRIASVTKQFTAAAVLRLAERGRLSLDDDITKYVDFPTPGATVTIRHLLTHTSGIKSYTDVPGFFDSVGRDLAPERVLDRCAGGRWTLRRARRGRKATRGITCWG